MIAIENPTPEMLKRGMDALNEFLDLRRQVKELNQKIRNIETKVLLCLPAGMYQLATTEGKKVIEVLAPLPKSQKYPNGKPGSLIVHDKVTELGPGLLRCQD